MRMRFHPRRNLERSPELFKKSLGFLHLDASIFFVLGLEGSRFHQSSLVL